MSALKKLSELEYKHRYQESTLPDYARFRKKFSAKSANALTQSIITWIRLHGGFAERISTTGRPLDQRKTVTDCTGRMRQIGQLTWIPGTSTKGSADISAVIDGKSIKIEVKMKDRQTAHQREYQKQVEAAGAVYYVARDFDSFVEFFNEITT